MKNYGIFTHSLPSGPWINLVIFCRQKSLFVTTLVMCGLLIIFTASISGGFKSVVLKKVLNYSLSEIEQPEILPPENLVMEMPRVTLDGYNFSGVFKTFGRKVDILRAKELTKLEFEKIVEISTPPTLRYRMKKYLSHVLFLSTKYQIDPFWVLSVMWTESHFKKHAKSHKKAFGLMQIMPDTGAYIAMKMKKRTSRKRVVRYVRDPRMNIEMGIFYLKKLLKKFRYNYRYATAAYNLGPARVTRYLRAKRQVGVRNHYLNKVRRAYGVISREYRRYLNRLPHPYEDTYVVRSKMAFFTDIELFVGISFTSDNLFVQLDSDIAPQTIIL